MDSYGSFLAGLLARKHQHLLFPSLKIVENLVQKLPGVVSSSFTKEGVIYAIDTLLMLDDCSQSLSQQSSRSESQVVAREACKCLCYAFESCHSSVRTKTCRLGKDAVLNLAGHIKASYFSNELVDCRMGLTEILRKLKTYCSELNDNGGKYLMNDVVEKEDYLSDILGQVLRELSGGDSMSTFEFAESGIVKSLLNYLCNGRYLQGTLGSENSSDHSLSVLTRFQTFAAISLSTVGPTWEDTLLTSFIRKLQSALSSYDNFPVMLCHTYKPRNVIADIPFRHATVRPCLRIRFVREEGEDGICEYNEVITVELSSSLDVIEGYLWPKVSGNKSCQQPEPSKGDNEKVDLSARSKLADEILHQEAHGDIMIEPSVPEVNIFYCFYFSLKSSLRV